MKADMMLTQLGALYAERQGQMEHAHCGAVRGAGGSPYVALPPIVATTHFDIDFAPTVARGLVVALDRHAEATHWTIARQMPYYAFGAFMARFWATINLLFGESRALTSSGATSR